MLTPTVAREFLFLIPKNIYLYNIYDGLYMSYIFSINRLL